MKSYDDVFNEWYHSEKHTKQLIVSYKRAVTTA